MFTVGSDRMIKTSVALIMSIHGAAGRAGDIATSVDQSGRYTGGPRGEGQASGHPSPGPA